MTQQSNQQPSNSLTTSSAANIHEYAAKGDLEGILRVYLEEADLMAKDSLGNTPLHYAAANDRRYAARGLMSFLMPKHSWFVKNIAGKTPFDVATPKIRLDMQLISMKTAEITDSDTLLNRKLVEEKIANPKETQRILLSIDGGGIKAILIAGTIMAIERSLGESLMSRVHWLGGTSAGGIISLMLGCGYSCSDTRKLFLREKSVAFCGSKGVFPKHESIGIEKTLKKYLGCHTRLSDIKTHKVMVTTAKVSSAPSTLILFRSYAPRCNPSEYEQYGFLNPEKIVVWKAARSTSAAPIYFESYNGHADGAIVCNNPCLTLMTDFFRVKKLENYRNIENTEEIGLVLSLGSGAEPVMPLDGIDIHLRTKISINKYLDLFGKGKNLLTLFMYQCTSSLAVASGQAREWAHSIGVPYFRFSPKLSKIVELDCTNLESIYDFMFENEVYLKTQVSREMKDLVRLLKKMPKNETQDKNSTVH